MRAPTSGRATYMGLRQVVGFVLAILLIGSSLVLADSAHGGEPKELAKYDAKIKPADRQHWSYQPVKRPAPPKVKNAGWVRNDIDRFVLARLEKEGLQPSPEADPRTLIRRLSFDLTGLPPTPEEVDAFVTEYASAKPQAAYEEVVDRLLKS